MKERALARSLLNIMLSFKHFRRVLIWVTQLRTPLVLLAIWCLVYVATTVVLLQNNSIRQQATARVDADKSEIALRNPSGPLEDAKSRTYFTKDKKRAAGKLNVHVWSRLSGFEVSSLKQSTSFPYSPDRKTFVSNFTNQVQERNMGQRLFGFVFPRVTGKYHFAITSDDTSELWLSTNDNPRNVSLIAKVYAEGRPAWTKFGDYGKYHTQMSGEIILNSDKKYFIEALHKNGGGPGHVSVLWKPPGTYQFSIITGQSLYAFNAGENTERCPQCNGAPSHFEPSPAPPPTAPPLLSDETFQYYYNTSIFSPQHLEGVLPVVSYNPSYVVRDGKVKWKQGIRIVYAHSSSVYPEDVVRIKPGYTLVRWSTPNRVLPKANAEQVVSQFMLALERQHSNFGESLFLTSAALPSKVRIRGESGGSRKRMRT